MTYQIQPNTIQAAKRLGLQVFPSDNPKYKIEVYDHNGLFLYYGGASRYSDYGHYLITHGEAYANTRRRLYHTRHAGEPVGSRGWTIGQLLW